MKHRGDIDAILEQYRTKKGPAKKQQGQKPGRRGRARSRRRLRRRRRGRRQLGRRVLPVQALTAASARRTSPPSLVRRRQTTELAYTCSACGFSETVRLSEFNRGKLVWKVDWPMRWAYEGVIFEPSAINSSPGSSFQVGGQIVGIFGGKQPIGPMYAFVGISGMAKMSSTRAGRPPPPTHSRSWSRSCCAGCTPAAVPTSRSRSPSTRRSSGCTTSGTSSQVGRRRLGPPGRRRRVRARGRHRRRRAAQDPPPDAVPHPRLRRRHHRRRRGPDPADPERARTPEPARLPGRGPGPGSTRPRPGSTPRCRPRSAPSCATKPDVDLLKSLDDQGRESLRLLQDGLEQNWSLDGLTHLVYGVPKVQAGFPADATAKELPSEIKVAQRTFFALLYHLLVGRDTGPRLPTLLLAVGQDRVRKLLGA